MTKVALQNQVYTLTDDNAAPYVHPDFTVDPDYCPLIYSYSETFLADGDSALILPTIANDDKTFNFSYTKDLVPLGQIQSATVTATSTSKYLPLAETPRVDSASFQLSFKNPCIDQDFVTINAPDFVNLEYIIEKPAKEFAAHPDFTLTILPFVHEYCGTLSFKGYYDSLDASSDPLTYDPAT